LDETAVVLVAGSCQWQRGQLGRRSDRVAAQIIWYWANRSQPGSASTPSPEPV